MFGWGFMGMMLSGIMLLMLSMIAQPPEGKILFESIRPWGNTAIYVMDADGGNPRMLIEPPSREPAWSPDGERIAFSADWVDIGEIYVADADGRGARRLTKTEGAVNRWPAWSPDGRKIAFVFISTQQFPRNPEIYVMDADGGNPRRLTNHPANDLHPTWSPDGLRIAFTTERDGNSEIYAVSYTHLTLPTTERV